MNQPIPVAFAAVPRKMVFPLSLFPSLARAALVVGSFITLSASGWVPKVGDVSLDELTRCSDIIAVCKVTRVEQVRIPLEESDPPITYPMRVRSSDWVRPEANIDFAEAEIVELLKGESSLKRVHFLAQGTWTCDVSDAKVGETALFFFEALLLPEGKSRPGFLEALRQFSSESPTYKIAHSGRGRMPLRSIGGDQFAMYWPEVVMPSDLTDVDGPDPRDASIIHSAPLPALAARVREYSNAHGARLRVREWRKGRASWSWSNSVWRDGRHSISYEVLDDHAAEIASNAEVWSCLGADAFLAWPEFELGAAVREFGIELEVLSGQQRRTVRLPAPEQWRAAKHATFDSPLRTMLSVLDAAADPATSDLRARYRAVIADAR